MKIYELTHITNDAFNAFKKLIPQLAPDTPAPEKERLEEIIKSGNTKLFVAEEGEIYGTLTLVMQKTPAGEKAWIEDVVVDVSARGRGIGEKLILFAVDYAAGRGITKIDLTSRYERIAANKLYEKLGFIKRKTNVYRLIINDDKSQNCQ